jgi:hypothetical protein
LIGFPRESFFQTIDRFSLRQPLGGFFFWFTNHSQIESPTTVVTMRLYSDLGVDYAPADSPTSGHRGRLAHTNSTPSNSSCRLPPYSVGFCPCLHRLQGHLAGAASTPVGSSSSTARQGRTHRYRDALTRRHRLLLSSLYPSLVYLCRHRLRLHRKRCHGLQSTH